MRDRHRALLDPDLVAIGMIAMVMRVEGKAHRLVGDRFDLGNDLLRAGGKIGVDDQDVILEDNPAIVAMAVPLDVAFMEINVGRDEFGFVHFGAGQCSQ